MVECSIICFSIGLLSRGNLAVITDYGAATDYLFPHHREQLLRTHTTSFPKLKVHPLRSLSWSIMIGGFDQSVTRFMVYISLPHQIAQELICFFFFCYFTVVTTYKENSPILLSTMAMQLNVESFFMHMCMWIYYSES